jgi:hypothetical protein
MIESPLPRSHDEQIEELGKEFDAIHDEVLREPRATATGATSRA